MRRGCGLQLEYALHEDFEGKPYEKFKDDVHISMSGRTTEGFHVNALNEAVGSDFGKIIPMRAPVAKGRR
jgi:hypothetical protein